jgi:hypothetical protein
MIGKKINQLATELAPESTDLTIIGDPISGVSKKITLAQLGAIFSGAVSFYTNLAAFPVTGDINVIYCAKDTQKLYLWSGSAYVEVFPSQALLNTYQLRSEKGVSNGYASLDSGGKVPISQLPSSIMEYKGTWNAATNTPTLANGTGDTGDVYICNVAGTVNFGAGAIAFAVGDYVIYSGTIWQRSSGAVGTVTSVGITESGDSLTITGSPITTSGTINIGFAGNSTQYINGAGNLVTFPGVINEAQNLITEVYNKTGATLTKGTVVYINGGQGNLPAVTKALATGDSTSAQTYGIVRNDITNNNNGYVVVAGRISDLDTQAFTEGTQLYLSSTTAGTYTSTKQYAPNHLVYVGIVVRAHPTQGVIEVKIQNGYEMDELHNVAAQSPSNNDGIFYNTTTSLWEKKSIATVLGYTPANAATYVPYTGATANVNLGDFDLSSRSAYLEGTASYQAGLLIKQRGLYNFVTGAYTQIVADSATDLNIVHNQANTTRRRYALSVAALQDGDSFQYAVPRANGTIALTSNLAAYLPLAGGTMTGAIIGTTSTFANAGSGIGVEITNSSTGDGLKINHSSGRALNIASSGSGFGIIINNSTASTSAPFTIQKQGSNVITLSDNGAANFAGQLTLGSTITNGTNTYTLPSATGTLALTSALSGYLPLAGGTLTGALGGTSATFSSSVTAGGDIVASRSTGGLLMGATNGIDADIVMEVSASGAATKFGSIGGSGASNLVLAKNGGNVGIGTSSISNALGTALQIGPTVNLMSYIGNAYYLNNWYYDSSGNAKYITSSFASGITQNGSGELRFFTNPSGTANATFTPAERLVITNSGNVGIGTTTPDAQLQVSTTSTSKSAAYIEQNAAGDGLRVTSSGNDGTHFIANFRSTGVDRMRILDNGNVGIGTNNPTERLHINNSSTNAAFIRFQNTGGDGVYVGGRNNDLELYAGGSLKAIILSGGNVGIGTTSPSTKFVVSNAGAGGIEMQGNSSVSGGAFLQTYNRSTNAFFDFDIVCDNMIFRTGQSYAERMRITSGGVLQIGGTASTIWTSSAASISQIDINTTFPFVIAKNDNLCAILNRTNSTGGILEFKYNGTTVGSVSVTGSLTSYNVTSDYRLKQDYKDYSGLNLVNKIKTYDYEWKSDGTRMYGVIAHELQSVINYAVTGVKDGKDMQGVDYSKIVPVLIKAIQELNDKIK